ncbi:MAG: SLC13/DASS family transporter [Phycisphaeraceae bacterium]|nr:MAG: SLC13/DASS family transporter [Phycisphaeraceae bacterium]
MTQQLFIGLVILVALVLFAWGKLRYDIVALATLLALTIPGIIPAENAFSGFGHPAVVTVAAVLVLSRGLELSGLVSALTALLDRVGARPTVQIGTLCAAVAICSGLMNNIGALALFLPVAVRMARKAGHSPSILLMPLAFASLLGGTMTLIGTPPNIIIASFRNDAVGEPFRMFDFTPIGAVVVGVGVLFLALGGWRLVPKRAPAQSSDAALREYLAELTLPSDDDPPKDPLTIGDLRKLAPDALVILSLFRNKRRLSPLPGYETVRPGDTLIVEADTETLELVEQKTPLKIGERDKIDTGRIKPEGLTITEVVVPTESPLVGMQVRTLRRRLPTDANILALASRGTQRTTRLDNTRLRTGDVMLLQLPIDSAEEIVAELGGLTLAERSVNLGKPRRLILALSLFILAIAASVSGLLALPVAFVTAAAAMVILKVLPLRESYRAIDWPIIVLLGAMIPVGDAVESSGAALTVAEWIGALSGNAPPFIAIAILAITTMLISNIINNAAAAVLFAPIAIGLADSMNAHPDPFLLAVAIGASLAFLTPIGHQSNTLILGPGAFRFADYWKLGLPMSILSLAVAIPVILMIRPAFPDQNAQQPSHLHSAQSPDQSASEPEGSDRARTRPQEHP